MDSNFRGVLMGGAPSTGSSVLVNVLNRHTQIVSGPETYLFIHPGLYQDWPSYARYLLQPSKWRGLKSIGWFAINGTLLEHPEYGWSKKERADMIRQANSLQEFATHFFQNPTKPDQQIWIEKSPSNVLCFDEFLRAHPAHRVIQTTRHPLDAIASLVARGQAPVLASAAYLINSAFGLKAASTDRYFLMKYEQWLQQPEPYLQKLLNFLSLNWEPNLLLAPPDGLEVKMRGWLQNEQGSLGTKSIGRFARLPSEQQEALLLAASAVQIRPNYARQHGLAFRTIPELAAFWQYDFPQISPRKLPGSFRRTLQWDQWRRRLRRYPTVGDQYPIQLCWG